MRLNILILGDFSYICQGIYMPVSKSETIVNDK